MQRQIVSVEYPLRVIESYGIISVNVNTGKVLTIKQRHSPGLFELANGMYSREDIPSLAKEVTRDELTRCFKDFTGFIRYVYGQGSVDVAIGQQKFLENKQIWKDNYERAQLFVGWSFPKGRPRIRKRKTRGSEQKLRVEKPLNTARREFKEETHLEANGIIPDEIVSTYIDHKGIRYYFSFFINLCSGGRTYQWDINSNWEVSETVWLPPTNLGSVYDREFLLRVKSIVSKHVLKIPRIPRIPRIPTILKHVS